jgi:HTH-type transcriptional repressor of NAD biosynthesis genes
LIEFAADQCDELIVSMSYTKDDPIDPALRKEWLVELLKVNQAVKVETIADDFDNEYLDWNERTEIWAKVLRERYPSVQFIFSSEPYGELLAMHLGATAITFDAERSKVPISASKIRTNPILYWDYIPKLVQRYFVVKICLYGAESTGKSTMAKLLAEKYNTEFVPEVAREIISSNDFTIEDIIAIGHAQTNRVKEKLKTANRFLFCDTDLITTQIYSKHYLGEVPPVLVDLVKEIQYDLYFLFDIDVPWINDGLRDLGNQRIEMMKVFEAELSNRNIIPILVKGTWKEREVIINHQLKHFDSRIED